jgi:hypothetical protein
VCGRKLSRFNINSFGVMWEEGRRLVGWSGRLFAKRKVKGGLVCEILD